MKRTLLAIAASLALGFGTVSATSTAAEARVNVSVGIGFYSGYYPRHRYVYPYRVAPRHLVCYNVVKKRVYWRHHVKHVVYVKDRVCRWKYRW